ncbi:hypothetical protein KPH14_010455 [Odynerus spinipes]|uniref:Uncharacterized protein n=1 Tax=Odynerus spinipes TaxID=1348599 RepID=A0AAD9RVA8_9HYME|nr:hypothetical protein KPH14_010455 [Odynerus spinipes]
MSDTFDKADIDDASQTSIKCPNFNKSLEEQRKYDRVRICSIAISTVMMMATRSYNEITTEHVKYMEMYFQNLKAEDKYPRNVTSILQILENLRNSGTIENVKMEEINMEGNEEDILIDDLIN